MILLWTALAGGFGGAMRFLVDTWVARVNRLSVPMGTVVINVTACLLLGMLNGFIAGRVGFESLAAIVGVGVMGGYSTFSTASVEGARLLRAKRYRAGLVHAGGMLLLSLLAAYLGLWLGGLLV